MATQEGQTDVQHNTADMPPISFTSFLETKPPSQLLQVNDFFSKQPRQNHVEINAPDLRLHCTNETCNGVRYFRYKSGDRDLYNETVQKNIFLSYLCSNCESNQKMFALHVAIDRESDGCGKCYKFGEYPAFGPATPSRLLRLLKKDREIFLKGRRCEAQGLGIGAFSYYRRVVENQKDMILEQIIAVAQRVGASADAISQLQAAKKETQFTKAIASVRDALPQSLLVGGHHNPLALLHKALSDGLHARSDEHCLELAQDIRLVLADLAERLSVALKDEVELNAAIARLGKIGSDDL
ncbi:hypothetical protein [Bradyrhizobium sp. WSM4349]|uniref:hypothetical protein n=1 Tax=Bradyrhizobium sp. WSM4349 TaxID=1040988 RepID=UPI0003743DA8|nr:hypothetical protein [Bradyrhizobium sp. WSM4349]